MYYRIKKNNENVYSDMPSVNYYTWITFSKNGSYVSYSELNKHLEKVYQLCFNSFYPDPYIDCEIVASEMIETKTSVTLKKIKYRNEQKAIIRKLKGT